jgi:succinate dehydrogenase / fumarate reductase membrane anchor subunit
VSIETPIARVRGLGSAHSGAHHWWVERLTSVSTLLLFFWLGASLLTLPALDQKTIVAWLASPTAAVPMLLLILSTFWHLKLGLQVVIDDYVHEAGWKIFAVVLLNFFTILLAALAIFAVLKIALGGAVNG